MKIKKSQLGFTLVEAMVALVILTFSLSPLLYLASTAVNTAAIIRDDMIGANLAQEGIEVVRNIRDSNFINNISFDSGLSDGDYVAEWNSTSLTSIGGINPPLKNSNGLYNYSFGNDTGFSRKINITKVNASDLRVTSTVSWTLRGGYSKSVVIESHLLNWK